MIARGERKAAHAAERSRAAAMAAALAVLILIAWQAAAVAGEDPAKGTSQDENPHLWKPRTKSVAVFKNGLGFFMRQGEVRLRDGWCVAEHIPPAAFGTLAIYALSEEQMVDVVGSGPGEVVEFDGRDARTTRRASGPGSRPAGT